MRKLTKIQKSLIDEWITKSSGWDYPFDDTTGENCPICQSWFPRVKKMSAHVMFIL